MPTYCLYLHRSSYAYELIPEKHQLEEVAKVGSDVIYM